MSSNYYADAEHREARESADFHMSTSSKDVLRAVSDAADAVQKHMDAQKQLMMKDPTGEIQSLYEQLVDLLNPLDTEAVQRFYQAGCLIRNYFQDHSDKDAKEVLGLFSRTLHLKQPVMAAAYKFAKEFTPDDVSELSALRNPSTGYCLTQTHLLYVMVDYLSDVETSSGVIRGVDRRMSYLRRAVEGSLPPIAMRKLIASENNQLASSGRGRTHRIPGTKNELLADMSEHLSKLSRRISNAWDNPEDPALVKLATDMSDVSETTRSELLKVVEYMQAVNDFCQRALLTLNEVDTLYTTAISGRSARMTVGTTVDTAVRTLG